MGCPACGRGFHGECEIGCQLCHIDTEQELAEIASSLVPNLNTHIQGDGQPIKAPENVKDRHSTGRKRAAQLYPLMRHRACEWQGKKNCGGGLPIIGCIDGLQQAIHHGPIKDTLENSPHNIHRICHKCHNRWHTKNDKKYIEEEWAKTKHEPEPADEVDLLANEMYWKTKPAIREKIED